MFSSFLGAEVEQGLISENWGNNHIFLFAIHVFINTETIYSTITKKDSYEKILIVVDGIGFYGLYHLPVYIFE
uniref:Uncharacterized protein n=1 Tax=Anguilla anguilla TaxID=7936 RepID=A0A0E9TD29_ANGAN